MRCSERRRAVVGAIGAHLVLALAELGSFDLKSHAT